MTTDFGKRVKTARAYAGLTQKELAIKAGTSQPNISDAENTAHSSQYTVQIANACGVSAVWLATGEGEMLNSPATAETPAATFSLTSDYIRARRISIRGAALVLPNDNYEEVSMTLETGVTEVEAYSDDTEAYALKVRGDGLFPTIRDGWFLVIEPNAEPVPGQFVLVTTRDGRRMVKELIIKRASSVSLMSVNGGERLTLHESELAAERGLQPIASLLSPTVRRPG